MIGYWPLLEPPGRIWNAVPESWYQSLQASPYVEQLTNAVTNDYGEAPIFLVKDPRICRFFPLWTIILRRLKAQPVVILPFRNPVEVAASLRHRHGFSLGHGYLLWLRHVLDAEFASRAFGRAFLCYEHFVLDARREIDRLEARIPVLWPRKSAHAYHEIEKTADIKLRHNVADPGDLIHRQGRIPLGAGGVRSIRKASTRPPAF